MTREEFLAGLKVLTMAYSKDMTQEQTAMWYSFFSFDDFQTFRTAIKKLCVTSRFFPSIADIKATMAETDLKKISADEAWNDVQIAIQRYGYYRPKEAMESLTDTTQAAIRSLGGFQRVCVRENDDWFRKDFCKIYDDIKGRDVTKYATGDLITIADIQEHKKMIEGAADA